MKTQTLLIALSLAVGITNSQAAVQTYTQSSAFFAALASGGYAAPQTETYESYADDTQIVSGHSLGSYTYSFFPSYGNGILSGRIDNTFATYDQTNGGGYFSVSPGVQSLAEYFTPTTGGSPQLSYFYYGEGFDVGTSSITRAIGLFFNVSAAANPGDLYITAGGGTASNGSAYDTTKVNNYGQSNLYFVGLISDTPFSTATIGEISSGAVGYNVDNLTTATPEPGTLGLLGFGLTGILGCARKRNCRSK